MSLSAEFERSFSARLNSGLQLIENRLSETLDTSVGTCIMGISSCLTISRRTKCGSNFLSSREVSFLLRPQVNASCPFRSLDHPQFVQSIAQLSASVNQLSDALNSSARELELMNIAQANAVQATEGLVGNIKRMNETVLSALIDINATAVRVNQTIGSYSFYSNFISLAGATVIDCEDHRNTSPCHCRD